MPSRILAIRVDQDAVELLDWWASILDVPLGSLLRAALEEARDEIAAALAPGVDAEMPDDVLLKRVIRHRLQPPTLVTAPVDGPTVDSPST